MINHIHHVHIFASNLQKSLDFYENAFDGKIILDLDMAGARNVFMRIGNGRLHFYDQPPKYPGRGNIHHFGIQTDNLDEGYKRLVSSGVQFNKGISDFGFWKYIMVPAPDDILIEYFEVNKSQVPKEYHNYFE
jgi:catechol 2,3-dioxygenase-like lactoylglutathione lyase family enzyme